MQPPVPPSSKIEIGTDYQGLSRVATPAGRVAALLWNQWPDWRGMGGRFEMESVAGLQWNAWPTWTGIRKITLNREGDMEQSRPHFSTREVGFSLCGITVSTYLGS
ncbi:MAG: hypothetical protein MUO52_19230, partial [Desulfobacterales bacterium]|nr:hypothetical protein [Desulfobacterales bacterium]